MEPEIAKLTIINDGQYCSGSQTSRIPVTFSCDGHRTKTSPLSAMGLRLRLFGLLVAAKLLVCMCGLTPVRVQSPLVELISPSSASPASSRFAISPSVRVDSSRFEMVRAYVDDGESHLAAPAQKSTLGLAITVSALCISTKPERSTE